MNRNSRFIPVLLCIVCIFSGLSAQAKTGIINTKHNLSTSGPGDIKAVSESRICVFCHTPHNANPQTPLWNRNMSSVTYSLLSLYDSSTLVAKQSQPTGSSRLCLGCHDGTIALGEVLRPSDRIDMTNVSGTGAIPGGSANFGSGSLANHHPVSFSYFASLPNPELAPNPPETELLFYNADYEIQCDTCHDPHDNSNKKFLVVNNVNSGLCILCHTMNGWTTALHATSLDGWSGAAPNPWPRTSGIGPWDLGWTNVRQNGCENCHSPHSAGGAQWLLNSNRQEENCHPCHNGNVGTPNPPLKNVWDQFSKFSAHKVSAYPGIHDPKEKLPVVTTHVQCGDCHNPHTSNDASASAPNVSGKTANVTGVDKSGIMPVAVAQYEYEICFKCHASSSTLYPFINRVINTTKANEQFNASNASYHPVTDIGRVSALDVPSIPTTLDQDREMPNNLTVSSYIYCTDCHSDEVDVANVLMSRGPHGSPYPPILRRQYVTTMGANEGVGSYGLCYRCHNRSDGMNGILDNKSFKLNSFGYGGHSGHLTSTGASATPVKAPCSVCHDPHGVPDNLTSGSHTHLINFDTSYVSGLGGVGIPLYRDKGSHTGSCTLRCHDAMGNSVDHDGSAKFSYGGGGGVQFHW